MEYDIYQQYKEPDVEQRKKINDQIAVLVYSLRVHTRTVSYFLDKGGA